MQYVKTTKYPTMSKRLQNALKRVKHIEQEEFISKLKAHATEENGFLKFDFTKTKFDELPCIAAYDSENPNDFLILKAVYNPKTNYVTFNAETKEDRISTLLNFDDIFIGQLQFITDYIQ